MGIDFYVQLNRRIRADRTKRRLVLLLNELLTYLIVLLYAVGLIMAFAGGNLRVTLMLILVPLTTFVVARLLRMMLKVPRPYRAAPIKPLVRKKKRSYSLPSCHVTSAFVIGTCMMAISMTFPGIPVLIAACALAFLRVLSGAHYIRDAAVGACIGILGGLVPFVIM